MQKRPGLIAAAAALFGLGVGLGVGFYLHAVALQHGFSVRALVGRVIGIKEPHAAVVMLGDSITARTDWNALLPTFDVANRGISGDTTEGVLKRLDSIIAMHPQCVAIMLGVNDLLIGQSVQQISENYTAIVDRLSASGAIVIVQSTLATSQSFARLNASVIDADRSLGEICRQSGRCLYLDLNSTVAPTGAIADTVDGVHIGPNSYKLWASALTPLLNAHCR
jgi:lysophospholipase L1-like esterase